MAVLELLSKPIFKNPDLFDKSGTLQPMPAAYWRDMSHEDRSIFGQYHGLYSYPTNEVIEILTGIAPAGWLEIGAGNGGYCKAMGIRGVDNYIQDSLSVQSLYIGQGISTIAYGEHVEKLDAKKGVEKYWPRAILAAWTTHKFDAKYPELGGDKNGIDEEWIFERSYIDYFCFIGNTSVHSGKPLLTALRNGKYFGTHSYEVITLDNCSRATAGIDYLLVAKRKRFK